MQIEPNGLERQLRRQGWRPDALATLAWEKKFAAEATRLGLLPELDFLLDVLPGRRASLLPFLVEGSAAALRQTDRWLNTGGSQISEIVLQASGDLMLSAEGANPLVGFVAEAPLAAALCARLPANRAGGLDAGKSLWLMARRAGAFNGREGAERVLADALRKAGSDPGWLKWLDHVVPAAQNLDVLNWLQQAALRAVRPLPAALNQDPKIDAQRIVVEALHRLMQTPPAVSRAATLLPYLDPGL
ncbi:MAG: hypothetical protein KGK18_10715, partial [Burkholderiales bacterium]|nr:hypothetical protein [Burkholderiales bacterium]